MKIIAGTIWRLRMQEKRSQERTDPPSDMKKRLQERKGVEYE
ncbi:hypothetical protein BRYFOR_07023 [Marvinbryantia formatexigens DSM 14469]|uniref:Uncharacterized protein n=1 Tax=Marvinbryantia formatexigens DSM 14469 TaxID=478749 RepID=C6LEH4_9FIRM|nr:hypothetical protein [Marvinbryantia formatexigens]EET60957.1 hypothetical protein BRYFOR_07023 [Marvinbryantia formatexigens DSM 14469]